MENQQVPPPQQPMPGMNPQSDLPNSVAVLVLGILSIVFFCFCYGVVGATLGIIALVLANKADKLYKSNPGFYKEGSYKNMKAGKVCAIIGLSLAGLIMIFSIIFIIIYGAALTSMPWDMINQGGY